MKELDVSLNLDIGDEGVVALAKALLEATEIRLWNLNLTMVGMTDVGVVALASIVCEGHFEELKLFSLAYNNCVTDQGMTALAQAMDAYGLPMLETFMLDGLNNVTDIGVGAIMDALIKQCPQLALIVWRHSGPPESDILRGKLHAAGRRNVEVIDMDRHRDLRFRAKIAKS